MTSRVRSSSPAAGFERGAARAEALAATGCDPEPLLFAAGLLRTQAQVVAALEVEPGARELTGRLADDLGRVLDALRLVPSFAGRAGPRPLAVEARSRAGEGGDKARARLLSHWSGAEDYLSRAMLRPYLELLRAVGIPPDRPRPSGRCPFCGGASAVGCLRGGAEAQGAARFLVCASCGLEHPLERILCPACGERDPVRLPGFTSVRFPAVRLEACDSCRRYVKSIDLSLDARPIPEVDDLASLALDLWVRERGFARLEPGLAGI